MLRRRLLVPLVALLVAASACGGGSDELVIYSGRTQNLVGPLLEQFAEDTGVPIAVRYGDSADLALLLAEEGDATDADVLLSQSPGAVAFADEQGLLAPSPDDAVAGVDEAFRAADNAWVGVTGRRRVLVYDSTAVSQDELPGSVLDLTDPRWRGRVGVAPTNGSFQDFVSAMREALGDDRTLAFLEGLRDNEARPYANNNAIVDAVARGEVDVGLVNHYYNHRFLAEDPSLPTRNHVFPGDDVGSIVIPSSVSVTASTDRPEQARRFVAYLLSPDAQRYFRDETFEYPLAGDLAADPDLPPLDLDALPRADWSALGEDLRSTVELIDRSGLGG